jgi:hypothetical protein
LPRLARACRDAALISMTLPHTVRLVTRSRSMADRRAATVDDRWSVAVVVGVASRRDRRS